MQPPPKPKSSVLEDLSRPAVVLLRYLFFVLIFFLLLSIAAGLLRPGQEFGRYALLTTPMQSCEDLRRELARYNVNQVEFRVEPAGADEFPEWAADGQVCWLELAGVSEATGVSAAAAPVYLAALDQTQDLLREDEIFYEPRYGDRETLIIWLLSFLLGAVVLFLRMRRKPEAEQR